MRRLLLGSLFAIALIIGTFVSPRLAAAFTYVGNYTCSSVVGHYVEAAGRGNIDIEYISLNAGDLLTFKLVNSQSGTANVQIWDGTSSSSSPVGQSPLLTPGQSWVFVVPYTLSHGWEVEAQDGASGFSTNAITMDLSCGGTAVKTFPITVWGPVNVSAVAWQWQDSSGQWWWFSQDGSHTLIQTPIEYRDRIGSSGQVVPHYAMSRIISKVGTTPNTPKSYRAFNATTLAPLHQVWIEIGDENDPNRKSVFVP